jgi:hypothetical protein
MKRAGIIGTILILGTCGVGIWLAARPPVAPVLVAGATDIQVVRLGLWEQQISYYVPGRPYGWYWTVARQLEGQQWKVNRGWHPELTAPSYNPLIPLIFERITLGFLVEEIILDPDTHHPNVAHIRIRRRIAIAEYEPPQLEPAAE